MKKILVCALLLLIAFALTACSDDDAKPADTQPQENLQSNATPVPAPTFAPTPTPFPRVAVDNYVLIWKSNPSRGINYMVPTHWTVGEEGKRYISYYEPVPEGESPFRVAFANKKVSKEPDASKMKTELKNYLKVFENQYTDFSADASISREYKLVKFKGYASNFSYTDDNGTKIRGFAIMATYNRRIYLMSFTGPADRFEEMIPIGQKMMNSMARAS